MLVAKHKVETEIKESSRCPNCGESRLIPIAYGLPGPGLMELWEQGRVVLGGCVLMGDDPQLHCSACDHDVWVDGRTRARDEWPIGPA